jgi:hypothetical protein
MILINAIAIPSEEEGTVTGWNGQGLFHTEENET